MWKRKAVIWIHTLFQCDIFEDIAEDVKTSFDTSSYELNIPFKRQFKDELDGKSMTKFVRLRANICGYPVDDGSEDKIAKFTKKCVIKW